MMKVSGAQLHLLRRLAEGAFYIRVNNWRTYRALVKNGLLAVEEVTLSDGFVGMRYVVTGAGRKYLESKS